MPEESNRRSRIQLLLDVSGTVCMIAVTITLIWFLAGQRRAVQAIARPATSPKRATVAVPTTPVSVSGAAVLGSASARAVIVEYSDFQCPYCGVFARNILPTLESKYLSTGKVQLAFKHLPLESLHPRAARSAAFAACAAEQGKFWEFHKQLFDNQKALEDQDLNKWASASGVEPGKLETCLRKSADRVNQDAAEAKGFGIAGTPTFFIGTRESDGRVKVVKTLVGAASVAQFESALEPVIGK